MSATRILLLTTALAFLVLALAPTAAAHASMNTPDGKIRVTWGFLEEPAFTHSKLRLDLIIREAGSMAGIGTVSNLSASLVFGDETYDFGDINAYRGPKSAGFAGPGNFTGSNPVALTREGIYALHVRGSVNGTDIDLRIPANHEYHHMSHIAFPDDTIFSETGAQGEAPDVSALEARIAALEQQVAALRQEQQTQSTTPAPVTTQTPPTDGGNGVPMPVFVATLGAVAAALLLRRRA